jgi:acyl-coenzyme A thioesterase PaaI-like protein
MPDFLTQLRNLRPDSQQLSFFDKLQATRKWLSDPAYECVGLWTRLPRTDGENDLLAVTLQTPTTVPHWVMLLRTGSFTASSKSKFGSRSQPDLLFLVDLHRGINGFKDTGHGGILSTLLDEGLSYCAELYQRVHFPNNGSMMYTANLNVDFRAPFMTPGVGIVKVWLTKVDGRKYWLSAVLEDKNGTVTTEAKALCIMARQEKM